MKKRLLALSLTLALCLGLLALPAGAISLSDAEIYYQKVNSHNGSSYLVDFDGDGREELVLVKRASDGSATAEVWLGDVSLGQVDVSYGTQQYGVLSMSGKGSKAYLVATWKMIRLAENDIYDVYTVENGKLVEKYSGERNPYSFDWSMEIGGTEKASVKKRLSNELKALEAMMPTVPNVPAAPLGSGLTPAPAAAIETLKNVPYYGDRAAISMTRDQAAALLNQAAWYASVTTNPSYPGTGPAVTYAALFDTGAGVPGLFMAKGYCMSGGSPSTGSGTVIADFGECALWHFKDGQLTLFAPATYSANYFLYPACVAQYDGAPDGSYEEDRYFAMNYGSISTTPATTVVQTETAASVDGFSVSLSKAEEFKAAWQGSGQRAYAAQGGGVEYVIYGMAPVADLTAALEGFVAALDAGAAPMAHPSTQNVSVDGVPTPFQFYALKDQSGNDTNYIKLRDLAYVLNGTDAQFDLVWDGAVNIEPGRPYTPNNSEMSTPFSGQRAYTPATAPTKIGAKTAELDAIVLTDDNGGAYTYYKLRDLGSALGFTVGWTAERGVYIETK